MFTITVQILNYMLALYMASTNPKVFKKNHISALEEIYCFNYSLLISY